MTHYSQRDISDIEVEHGIEALDAGNGGRAFSKCSRDTNIIIATSCSQLCLLGASCWDFKGNMNCYSGRVNGFLDLKGGRMRMGRSVFNCYPVTFQHPARWTVDKC